MVPRRKSFINISLLCLLYFGLAIFLHRGHIVVFSDNAYIITSGDFRPEGTFAKFESHIDTQLWDDMSQRSDFETLPRYLVHYPIILFSRAISFVKPDFTPIQLYVILEIGTTVLMGLGGYYLATTCLRIVAHNQRPALIQQSSLIAGLVYMINPMAIYIAHHILLRVVYAVLPTFLAQMLKILMQTSLSQYTSISKLVKDTVILVILWSIASFSVHYTVFCGVLFLISVCYFVLLGHRHRKKLALWVGICLLLYILLNAYWIYPYLCRMVGHGLDPGYVLTNASLVTTNRNATILNTLKLKSFWMSDRGYTWIREIAPSMADNIDAIGWLCYILPTVIMALWHPDCIRHSHVSQFLLTIAMGVVLLVSLPALNDSLYYFVLDRIPLAWMLRETDRLLPFFVTVISYQIALFIYVFSVKLKALSLLPMISILIGVSLYSFPLWSGNYGGDMEPAKLPPELVRVNERLATEFGRYPFKLAWLPRYNQWVTWMPKTNTPLSNFYERFSYVPSFDTQGLLGPKQWVAFYGWALRSYTRKPIYNLFSGSSTRYLGRLLAPLDVKYLVLHNDILDSDQVERLSAYLGMQVDLEPVSTDGMITVYENLSWSRESSKVMVPVAVMSDVKLYNSLIALEKLRNYHAVFFEDFSLRKSLLPQSPIVVLGPQGEYDWAIKEIESALELEPQVFYGDGEGFIQDSTWEVTYSKWREILAERQIENWQMDFDSSLYYSLNTGDELRCSFVVPEMDSYVLLLRLFCSTSAETIDLQMDDNMHKEIITRSTLNRFRWFPIELNLAAGKHVITLRNAGGLNAVNLLMLVPANEWSDAKTRVFDAAQAKQLVYIYEGETDFTSSSLIEVEQSSDYVNGAAVKLSDSVILQQQISVLQSGYYTLEVRATGDLIIDLNSESWFFGSDHLVSSHVATVHLHSGNYTMTVTGTSSPSFLDVLLLYSEDSFAHSDSTGVVTNHTKRSPTLHEFQVESALPFLLAFSEAYDPQWVAVVNGKEIESMPVNFAANGFWIEETGDLEIEVEYKPQRAFACGSVLSLSTAVVFAMYLIGNKFAQLRKGCS